MNAVLASIADGGQAIIVIDRKVVEINIFLLNFIDCTKTLQRRPRSTPSEEAPGGGVHSSIKPSSWRGKQLQYGGDVCVIVFS